MMEAFEHRSREALFTQDLCLRSLPVGEALAGSATGPRATAGAWAHVPPESVLLFA